MARLWILDDSPLQADLARRVLAEHDVTVFVEGTQLLEAFASGDRPNLLVLDWNMPVLSGLEVCVFIRTHCDAAALPILVLTGSGTQESLVEALEAGANDFVVKPFKGRELQARVAALLRTKDIYARLASAEQRLRVEATFRETFIGMLAHDLRQPLNTIVLANGALAGEATAARPTLFGIQRRAADRMARMIAELLDFTRSRPETGMPVQRKPMDLGELAHAIVDELRLGHPEQPLDLIVEGECRGDWDADRLAQLVGNLIGNAMEHGAPRSPILLSIRRVEDSVVVSVSNRGEPIPPELTSEIFSPFRRALSMGRRSAGVGLGLHIVSEIARAHRGKVSVTSNAEATTFSASLPCT